MDTKKKAMYAVVAVIGALFAWQVLGMFGAAEIVTGPTVVPNPETPRVAKSLPKPAQQAAPMTEREMQLMKLQQETEAKYLAALNELQMLKVEKDIAETSRDVSKAKLDGIIAQKSIVDLLAPPKPTVPTDAYAQGLNQQRGAASAAGSAASTNTGADGAAAQQTTPADAYVLVSVSRLRGQWTAVMGFQGSLYSIKVGDVMPGDGSTVVDIQKDGVQLDRNGVKRKISMVPII